MQHILSKIKDSLEESKNRIESGNHENHDLLPSLLLILVELMEQNKESNEHFILAQKTIVENESKERSKDLFDLAQDNLKSLTKLTQENEDFLNTLLATITEFLDNEEKKLNNFIKKTEESLIKSQDNQKNLVLEYISKNKTITLIVFIIL